MFDMRILFFGPRMFGGIVRAGVSLSRRDMEFLAKAGAVYPPSLFDRLLYLVVKLCLCTFALMAIGAVGLFLWALFFHQSFHHDLADSVFDRRFGAHHGDAENGARRIGTAPRAAEFD